MTIEPHGWPEIAPKFYRRALFSALSEKRIAEFAEAHLLTVEAIDDCPPEWEPLLFALWFDWIADRYFPSMQERE